MSRLKWIALIAVVLLVAGGGYKAYTTLYPALDECGGTPPSAGSAKKYRVTVHVDAPSAPPFGKSCRHAANKVGDDIRMPFKLCKVNFARDSASTDTVAFVEVVPDGDHYILRAVGAAHADTTGGRDINVRFCAYTLNMQTDFKECQGVEKSTFLVEKDSARWVRGVNVFDGGCGWAIFD